MSLSFHQREAEDNSNDETLNSEEDQPYKYNSVSFHPTLNDYEAPDTWLLSISRFASSPQAPHDVGSLAACH
ncbi:hypothetical protein V6N12_070525 [Hibiscus sabdariffa]|uniref:Uncharacterized protein n=1 Tax=Hibiscus sabdariffa TaxID=183260 RepID=A0ABR2FH31_9ROSI